MLTDGVDSSFEVAEKVNAWVAEIEAAKKR